MKEDNQLFENRKKEHIKYSLAESCQSKKQESLYSELLHDPLPNFNFSDIAISTYSLGKKRATPFGKSLSKKRLGFCGRFSKKTAF
jgi:isopentenyl diphosphate isomerase/L-lactate dehydrogenase-like FMN-dependent dehydrogenase